MSNALTDARNRLAVLRAKQAEIAETMKARQATFNETVAWLVEDRKSNDTEVASAENELRALALESFRSTNETRPVDGVEIKMFSSLQYSPDSALAWARETKMALTPESLDVKAFEKIAKATALPFVTTVSTPRVQIATKLEVTEQTTVTRVAEPF